MSTDSLVDVAALLDALAQKRRVFHSEADFQFAFAWEAKLQRPELEVRLETHPEPKVRLDLELVSLSNRRGIAVELKYKTRRWVGSDRGERFELKSHGASDLGGYDVIKDIVRVERIVRARPGWSGLVVLVTNEAGYWRPRTHGRATNADAFRLSEGIVLSGSRCWGPQTGGTSKGRETALELAGSYTLHWSEFAQVDETVAGTFRSLVVRVPPADD